MVEKVLAHLMSTHGPAMLPVLLDRGLHVVSTGRRVSEVSGAEEEFSLSAAVTGGALRKRQQLH